MAEHKYTYWIKSGFFTGFQNLSIVVFGAINFIFLTRITTKDEFGNWALFLVITNTIEMSKNGLLKNGMMRFINSTEETEHVRITSSSLVLNSLISLCLVILVLILSGPASRFCKMPELIPMLHLYLIALVVHICFSHCEYVQCSHADFKGISWSYFARQAVLFVFILACWLQSASITLNELVWYYILAMVAGALISLSFAWKYFKRSFQLSILWIKSLWNYGRYVFGTNISYLIFRSTDHFIVASYISASAVAIYNTAVRVTNFVDLPSNILSDILFPRSAKSMALNGPAKVKYLYEKSVGVVLALAVPASLVIFFLPSLILEILAGKKYIDAAPVLQVTLAFGLFLPYIRQFGTIMDSIGKPRTNFLVNFSTVLFNLGANLFFTIHFGLLGAAYGTLVSYFFCFLAGQVILYRELQVSFYSTFKFAWGFYPEIIRLIKERMRTSRGSALDTIENEIH